MEYIEDPNGSMEDIVNYKEQAITNTAVVNGVDAINIAGFKVPSDGDVCYSLINGLKPRSRAGFDKGFAYDGDIVFNQGDSLGKYTGLYEIVDNKIWYVTELEIYKNWLGKYSLDGRDARKETGYMIVYGGEISAGKVYTDAEIVTTLPTTPDLEALRKQAVANTKLVSGVDTINMNGYKVPNKGDTCYALTDGVNPRFKSGFDKPIAYGGDIVYNQGENVGEYTGLFEIVENKIWYETESIIYKNYFGNYRKEKVALSNPMPQKFVFFGGEISAGKVWTDAEIAGLAEQAKLDEAEQKAKDIYDDATKTTTPGTTNNGFFEGAKNLFASGKVQLGNASVDSSVIWLLIGSAVVTAGLLIYNRIKKLRS